MTPEDLPEELTPAEELHLRIQREIEEEQRTARRLARFDSRTQRLIEAIRRRTAPEAAAITGLLRRLGTSKEVSWDRAFDVATSIVLAGDRTLQRRKSDRHTDRQRRVLVGARIPRRVAQEYARQAGVLGWSMYRWAVEALHLGYQCLMEGLPQNGAENTEPTEPQGKPLWSVWDGSTDLADPDDIWESGQ